MQQPSQTSTQHGELLHLLQIWLVKLVNSNNFWHILNPVIKHGWWNTRKC